MKDILRDTLYFWNWLTFGSGEFSAKPNSLKAKILRWIYEADKEDTK
jgi:hypothetical protein